VQETVKPYFKAFDQIQFRVMMGGSAQLAEPDFLKIGEQQWGRIVSSVQFRVAASEVAFPNFAYYSIINNRLMILYYLGTKNPEGVKAIEDFVRTIKPSNKVTA